MKKLTAAVYGATGYVGLELIRHLLSHPHVELVGATSGDHSGKALASVHRALSGVTKIALSPHDSDFSDCDIVFLAVPHTQSIPIVTRLAKSARFEGGALRLIDLGGDFRLNSQQFEEHYKQPHGAPALLQEAVYGSPEINAKRIKSARLVANPGCFANCTLLSLAPIVTALQAAGHRNLTARVSAITGSTGSGVTPTSKTHHPERNESFSAYEILTHRHTPEIERALNEASGVANGTACQINLVPISGPLSRGIFATSFLSLPESFPSPLELYYAFSERHPFYRLRESSPRTIEVRGSNFFDCSIQQRGRELVIVGTLDNLVKGAGGNAIQNMNLMFGFPETTGLLTAPISI